ncbi:MAG: glycosyltransferase [Alphaproteobacteria bacterium]
MLRVHILTEGFVSPNGRAFLFPLIVHRRALTDVGIRWRMFHTVEDALYDCDVLIVESKYHQFGWIADTGGILAKFASFKERIDRVLYFDVDDSTGLIHPEVLPFVDAYCKAQLLKDRRLYLRPMYGNRIFADYYHRKYGVTDSAPVYSQPVADPALLDKLCLSWNSGLADYSLFGPSRTAMYQRVPFHPLLCFPRRFVAPSVARENDLSCRMRIQYSRASVAHQRRLITQRLAYRSPTGKVSRGRYFRELAQSKIVVSPFGFGEITLKDFEVFLTGGLLLKPDMSRLETWPDLFRAGHTIVVHDWDLENLEEVIDTVLENYSEYKEIAEAGQETYRRYIDDKMGTEAFVCRFAEIAA